MRGADGEVHYLFEAVIAETSNVVVNNSDWKH